MPYITKEQRVLVDESIESICEAIQHSADETDAKPDGIINYTFTSILKEFFEERVQKLSYVDYERAIGLLEACKLEFYAMRVRNYEDKKRIENGDV